MIDGSLEDIRILVVDDEPPARQRLIDLLRQDGHVAAVLDWIEGAGVYVNLHVAGKAVLYRAALNQLAARLDPARFIRVHRSAIINIDSIVRLEPATHGEFDVILKHKGQTRVSRTYRFALEQRLGQSL